VQSGEPILGSQREGVTQDARGAPFSVTEAVIPKVIPPRDSETAARRGVESAAEAVAMRSRCPLVGVALWGNGRGQVARAFLPAGFDPPEQGELLQEIRHETRIGAERERGQKPSLPESGIQW
jgi:hypothetical protein